MSVSATPQPAHTMSDFQRRGLSLRLRLVALILVIAVPVFLVIALAMHTEARRLLLEYADNQIAANNSALKNNVATWLELNTRALKQLASLPGLADMNAQQQKPYLQAMTAANPNMYLVSTTDLNGLNVARSDAENLTNYSDSAWFAAVRHGAPLALQTQVGKTTGRPSIVAATPISRSGEVVGVVMFSIDLTKVLADVNAARLGKTGYAYVIDDQNLVVAHPDPVLNDYALHDLSTEPAVVALRQNMRGQIVFTDEQGKRWHAYLDTLPNGWGIIAQQPEEELFIPLRNFQLLTIVVFAVGALLLIVLSWFAIGRALRPISDLTVVATAAATGSNLNVTVPVKRHDEVGALADAFNTMIFRLRELIGSLEQRVQARTEQLQASAEVGRAAVSNLDTDQLLREIVNLITNRFGFYYAAVFLADDTNHWAVLREATGEAGRILKERQHQLEIGGQSMVGSVMQTPKARIALDIGADAVRFANPLLPDTRSEIALPLIVGDHVLGALDVQSTQAAAFDETSAAVLQSMADQIAIALNTASQFQQTQAALQRTNLLYATTQSLAEAKTAQDTLLAIVDYIGMDANRSGLFSFGPRRETGELEYVELAATWVHPDYVEKMQVLKAGTRFTPEQMPVVNFVAPDQPFIVRDSLADDLPVPLRNLMLRFGARALIALPLVAGKTMLGALVIGYYAVHQFDPDHQQVLTTLARQIAIVWQNLQSVQASQSALAQLDQANRRLMGEAWHEYAAAVGGGVRKVKLGYGVSLETAPASLPSTVTAPVAVNGVEIGALRLEDAAADREWTPAEVSLLQAVASEVSIALERTRLIEDTQRSADRERTINRIAGSIRSARSVDEVLTIATQELRLATQAARSVVEIAPAADQSARNGNNGEGVKA